MTAPLVLGVDGGDTKTVALLAAPDGSIVGAARAGGSDIYAYPDPADAVAVLRDVVARALDAAGACPSDVRQAVFCLAGADWPEDIELLEAALVDLLPGTGVEVLHDSQGHLWAGHPDGEGVAVAFGTAVAVGARHRDGRTWSSTNWLELSGSTGLGHDALRAVFDAHLGTAPPTALTAGLVSVFGVDSVDTLAHLLTNRTTLGRPHVRLSDVGPLVLGAAAEGDPVARGIVRRHVDRLAGYVGAAARMVGLEPPLRVTLGGGPTRHPSGAILAGLCAAVDDGTSVTRCGREPAVGCVIKAMRAAGDPADDSVLARLDATCPEPSFFATLPSRSDVTLA